MARHPFAGGPCCGPPSYLHPSYPESGGQASCGGSAGEAVGGGCGGDGGGDQGDINFVAASGHHFS